MTDAKEQAISTIPEWLCSHKCNHHQVRILHETIGVKKLKPVNACVSLLDKLKQPQSSQAARDEMVIR